MIEQLNQAERRSLRRVLDNVGDGILLVDRKEHIFYINAAAAQILDCVPEAAMGKLFADVCPLQDLHTREALPDPVRQSLQEKRIIGLRRNAGIQWAKGTLVYLSATCSPLRNIRGEIRGCAVILRNVSEMRRLELQLENERRSLQIIFSAASIGMCSLDCSGAIIELNEAAANILQLSHDAALGCQFGDAFHCENSLEAGCGHGAHCPICPVRRNLQRAISEDRFSTSFTVLMHRALENGIQPVWLKLFLSQAWNDEKKQIVVSLVDISERRAYEQVLDQARQEAEAASQAKGQFLANMSHEIRTPINGMLGMIELTLRSSLTAEQRENLLSAKQCSEDLLRIINDILDFSKLDNGKMDLEEIRYDLPETLARVTRVHEKVAKGKGLAFVQRISPELPHYIYGDSLRLRQILHNLLSNALKFTLQGTVSMAVFRQEKGGKSFLQFQIADTGIGMEKHELGKLFQAFQQVDGSTTRRFGGTGLGLMIVRKLIEAMQGHITVTSEAGKGSTFAFSIPYQEAEKADEELRDQSVFINPHAGIQKKTEDLGDVLELLQYCETKLKGTSEGSR